MGPFQQFMGHAMYVLKSVLMTQNAQHIMIKFFFFFSKSLLFISVCVTMLTKTICIAIAVL